MLELFDPAKEDEYDEDPEYSDLFEPALWLIHQAHDIRLDPTVDYNRDRQQRLEQANLGVLDHTFGVWRIYVNWQTTWAQKIPPHHMAVEFGAKGMGGIRRASTEWRLVGIISPYLTMRTCWNCAHGNPIVNGRFDERGYWVSVNKDRVEATMRQLREERPDMTDEEFAQVLFGMDEIPDRVPAVWPHHPCSKCGEYDWFGDCSGVIARPEDFQRDCAESLAIVTGDDVHATTMREIHDPTGRRATRYAQTAV